MKAGGNKKAHEFLSSRSDFKDDWSIPEKYNSRSAALLREKVAVESEDKSWSYEASSAASYTNPAEKPSEAGEDALLSAEFHEVSDSAPVHKKQPAKKITLGGKKTGLGAQKVKLNITEVEQKAAEFDKERENFSKMTVHHQEDTTKGAPTSAGISSKFLVQEIEKKKIGELKKQDSKDANKAEIVDRLGIGGGGGRTKVSHSIASDMRAIQQDGVPKTGQKKPADKEDDWILLSSTRDDVGLCTDRVDENRDEFFDAWDAPPISEKQYNIPPYRPLASRPAPVPAYAPNEDAVKKYGNAKAISSDQFFGKTADMDYETRANLSRFDGQTGIGSADLFGNGNTAPSSSYYSSYADHVPEMSDIKDSVKGAASKVAGKLSGIGSSVSSYLSDRY